MRRTSCRVCFQPLTEVFSLGDQYVSDFPKPGEILGPKVPLTLALCKHCGLVQLTHTAYIQHENYWYRSSTNKTMPLALFDVVRQADYRTNLQAGDSVLDIGCNDGTLLASYYIPGLYKVGFDPAENLEPISSAVADKIVCDCFTADKVDRKFRVVTSIAMFYDLEDPNSFVADVAKVMTDDGLWIVQMNYLPSMLEQRDFGNVCHEHLEYHSLEALEYLVKQHGLRVVDVELNDVNGGSLRAYIRKGSGYIWPEAPAVGDLRRKEAALGLKEEGVYHDFGFWANRVRNDVRQFVYGRCVGVYGASTKGNSMLQYFGLDRRQIACASDRNPDKWGRVMVGTEIPIVSEQEARDRGLDYFLVLPWHFLSEFRQREDAFLRRGGRFIVPLPEFRLI